MSTSRATGLPPGIEARGNGFRGRYRTSPESKKTTWSRTFPTAELCQEFLSEARDRWAQGMPTPKLYGYSIRRTWTFNDYAVGPWWEHYRRAGQRDQTAKRTLSFLRRHVLTAEWTRLPLSEVGRNRLQNWFDMRVDGAPSDAMNADPRYDYAADMAALINTCGPSVTTMTVDQLGLLLWLVKDVFKAAADDDDIDFSKTPAALVKLKTRPAEVRAVQTDAENLRKLMRQVTREHVQVYARLLPDCDLVPLGLMYACGLRVGEAYGLRICDWDSSNRRLSVVRQYQPTKDPATGMVTLSSNLLKTAASKRFMYVPAILATAIDRYIETFHGPDPDPTTAICVGVEGPERPWGRRSAFGRRVNACAQAAGLQVLTPERSYLPVTPHPHAFRESIASELHAAGVADAVVSRFLGHKLAGQFEGATVTADYYLDAFDRDLRQCAELINSTLEAIGVTFLPQDRSQFVSPREAAEMLGIQVARVYELMRLGQLTPIEDKLLLFTFGRRCMAYLHRDEVEAVNAMRRPAPSVAVTATDAAAMLGVEIAAVLAATRREPPELTRWNGPALSGKPRDTYITISSIEEWNSRRAAIASGDLLCGGAADRASGTKLRRVSYELLPWEMFKGRRYYRTDALRAFSDAGRPDGHVRVWQAAMTAGMSHEEFVAAAGLFGAAADPYAWIDTAIIKQINAGKEHQRRQNEWLRVKARAENPAIDVPERPDAQVWIPLPQAAAALKLAAVTVDNMLASDGAPRHRYGKTTLVRKVDVAAASRYQIPDGYITSMQARELTGASSSWIKQQCRNGQFTARLATGIHGQRWLILASDVHAWIKRNDPTLSQLMTVGDVVRELGSTYIRVTNAILAGELPCDGDVNTRTARGKARVWRSDFEAFKLVHAPLPHHITVSELHAQLAVAETNISLEYLHRALRTGKIDGAQQFTVTGRRWWLPPSAFEQVTAMLADGYLRPAEILRQAGFTPHPRLHNTLSQAAVRGLVPGAMRPVGWKRWAYPPECAAIVRNLLIARGFVADEGPPTQAA